jgi:hypothetical protein
VIFPIAISDEGAGLRVGARRRVYTIVYKTDTDGGISFSKEVWKNFHLDKELVVRKDVIIFVKTTTHKNLAVMFFTDTI